MENDLFVAYLLAGRRIVFVLLDIADRVKLRLHAILEPLGGAHAGQQSWISANELVRWACTRRLPAIRFKRHFGSTRLCVEFIEACILQIDLDALHPAVVLFSRLDDKVVAPREMQWRPCVLKI